LIPAAKFEPHDLLAIRAEFQNAILLSHPYASLMENLQNARLFDPV
jgi:hypothetical protein